MEPERTDFLKIEENLEIWISKKAIFRAASVMGEQAKRFLGNKNKKLAITLLFFCHNLQWRCGIIVEKKWEFYIYI